MGWRKHPVPATVCQFGFTQCNQCRKVFGWDLSESAARAWRGRFSDRRQA